MGANDIKAGGAFVEIGGKTSPLKKALSEASKQLNTWAVGAKDSIKVAAEGMVDFGAKLSALGGAMAAPLLLSSKAFADYGENIGKLSSKTGMSSKALAGLKYAADSSGIGIGAVATAVKGMQRAVVGGSKESSAALQKLGVSADQLKGMTPEDQFNTLADSISKIADPAERAAVAQQIFGKSAMEIMPILEGGSAEIQRMTREAEALGLVLGVEATDAALALDNSMDRLSGGITGLQLQIGAALAPVLTEVVDRFIDVVIAAQEWVKANPDMIVSFAKTAATVALAGAGFIVLGTGILAALSPAVLITTAIAGIGMALLAVTDTLGVTSTGFGELFNSIRIGGTGLGTWFASFWVLIEQGWNTMTSNLQYSWQAVWTGIKAIVRIGANFIMAIIEGIMRGIEKVATAANTILPDSMKIDTKGIGAGADSIKSARRGLIQNQSADEKSLSNILYERDKKNAQLEKRKQNLFLADPQDNTKGVSVDTSRAKAALENIGGNIFGAVEGLFGDLLRDIPRAQFEEPGKKPDALSGAATTKSEASSVGTFSGIAGGAIAARGVFDQQLETQREANKLLSKIERNTSGESSASFG